MPSGQVDIEEEPWCFSCIGFVTFLPAEESEDENFEDLGPYSCHAHRLMM